MTKCRKSLILLTLFASIGHTQSTPGTPSAPAAEVYFQSPVDGAETSETVLVQFGLSGMGVAPAGIDHPNTGHHHLLIDVEDMPPLDQPLPATDNIVHFGKGQTEATITLSPGKHTLQLAVGDYLHRPHDPPLISERITITVLANEEPSQTKPEP